MEEKGEKVKRAVKVTLVHNRLDHHKNHKNHYIRSFSLFLVVGLLTLS